MALQYLKNVFIWLDQGVNVLFLGGSPDETISARAWDNKARQPWKAARWVIDRMAFLEKDAEGNYSHCRDSWLSEYNKKHLPESYRREAEQ